MAAKIVCSGGSRYLPPSDHSIGIPDISGEHAFITSFMRLDWIANENQINKLAFTKCRQGCGVGNLKETMFNDIFFKF